MYGPNIMSAEPAGMERVRGQAAGTMPRRKQRNPVGLDTGGASVDAVSMPLGRSEEQMQALLSGAGMARVPDPTQGSRQRIMSALGGQGGQSSGSGGFGLVGRVASAFGGGEGGGGGGGMPSKIARLFMGG